MFTADTNDPKQFVSFNSNQTALRMYLHKNSQILEISLKGERDGQPFRDSIYPTCSELHELGDLLCSTNDDRRTSSRLTIERANSNIHLEYLDEDATKTTLTLNKLEAAETEKLMHRMLKHLQACHIQVQPTAPYHFLKLMKR